MKDANPQIPEIPGMTKIQESRILSAEHKNHCWRCPNDLIWAVFPPIKSLHIELNEQQLHLALFCWPHLDLRSAVSTWQSYNWFVLEFLRCFHDFWAMNNLQTSYWPQRVKQSDVTKWFYLHVAAILKIYSWLLTRKIKLSFWRIQVTMTY